MATTVDTLEIKVELNTGLTEQEYDKLGKDLYKTQVKFNKRLEQQDKTHQAKLEQMQDRANLQRKIAEQKANDAAVRRQKALHQKMLSNQKSWSSRMTTGLNQIKGLLIATFGTIAIAQVKAFGASAIQTAADINTLADAAGVAKDVFQTFRLVGQQVGVSQEKLVDLFGKAKTALVEAKKGNEKYINGLKALGLTVDSTQEDIVSALVATDDWATSLAVGIGDEGAKAVELLATRMTSTKKKMEEFKEAGVIISDENLEKLDNFAANMVVLKTKFELAFATIIADTELMDALTEGFEAFISVSLKTARGLANLLENLGGVERVFNILKVTLISLVAIKATMFFASLASTLKTTTIPAIQATIARLGVLWTALGPVGWVLVGVTAVSAGLAVWSSNIDKANSELDDMSNKLDDIQKNWDKSIDEWKKNADDYFDTIKEINKLSKNQSATLPNNLIGIDNVKTRVFKDRRKQIEQEKKLIDAWHEKVKELKKNVDERVKLIKKELDETSKFNVAKRKKLEEEVDILVNKSKEYLYQLGEVEKAYTRNMDAGTKNYKEMIKWHNYLIDELKISIFKDVKLEIPAEINMDWTSWKNSIKEHSPIEFDAKIVSVDQNTAPIERPFPLVEPKSSWNIFLDSIDNGIQKIKQSLSPLRQMIENAVAPLNAKLMGFANEINVHVQGVATVTNNILSLATASSQNLMDRLSADLDKAREHTAAIIAEVEAAGAAETDAGKQAIKNAEAEEKRIKKQMENSFKREKSLEAAIATINAFAAFNQTLATGGPWMIPIAYTSLALGLAQAAAIKNTPTPKFAQGGMVPGNSSVGDRVPAMVNSGEFIMNRDASQRNAEALEFMNRGGNMRNGTNVTLVIEGNVIQSDNWIQDTILPGINRAVENGHELVGAA